VIRWLGCPLAARTGGHTDDVRMPWCSGRWLCPALVVLASVAAGCSTDGGGGAAQPDDTGAPDPAVVAASNVQDPAIYASNGQPAEEEPGFVQVDANTATSAELVAAFESNGLAGAAELAAMVIAHRPYGPARADGGQFAALSSALEQAGVDDLTAGGVIASLTV
jgi:hypothetical protein